VRLVFYITALFVILATAGCVRGEAALGTAEDQLLKKSVADIGAESAAAGFSPDLCQISQGHLDYMLEKGKISHDNFETRNKAIQEHGGKKAGEIVANNCGIENAEKAARQCAESWDESPGHQKLMRQTWGTACYQMKKGGQKGCYFCIGLFANGLGEGLN